MISAALKAIDSLNFEGPKHEAYFDLGVRKYGTHGDGCDFQVAIYGAGFEATRNLNRDDLLTIRDWIDEALMASEAKADAA